MSPLVTLKEFRGFYRGVAAGNAVRNVTDWLGIEDRAAASMQFTLRSRFVNELKNITVTESHKGWPHDD